MLRSKGLALDLFCGTGSVGAQFIVHGFTVVSLDCQPSAKADIIMTDVLVWDYKKDYKPGNFTLKAAGVPRTEYAVAKTSKPQNLEETDRLVAKTFAYFRPKRWWIENPR